MSELERELPDQWPDDEDLYYPPGIKLGPPELLMLGAGRGQADADPPSLKLRRAGDGEPQPPAALPMNEAAGPHGEPLEEEAVGLGREHGTLNLERGTVSDVRLELETRNEEPGTALTADDDDEDDDDHDAVSPPARRLTARELAARKRNAQFAGVKTEEGKAVSRLNACKHGVFATALTPLDHRELRSIFDEFAQTAQPQGAIEEALVEKMALCWLRIQRCARAEAELHADVWLPTVKELRNPHARERDPWRRAGQSGFFKPQTFEKLVSLVHRYDTSLTNQLMRLMHELERVQRRRTGEPIVPPVSADINVTGV